MERETPGILNCSGFKSFWLSWSGGSISIGEGLDIGERVVLNYQEVRVRDIKAISFSTADGFIGNFTMDFYDGKYLQSLNHIKLNTFCLPCIHKLMTPIHGLHTSLCKTIIVGVDK